MIIIWHTMHRQSVVPQLAWHADMPKTYDIHGGHLTSHRRLWGHSDLPSFRHHFRLLASQVASVIEGFFNWLNLDQQISTVSSERLAFRTLRYTELMLIDFNYDSPKHVLFSLAALKPHKSPLFALSCWGCHCDYAHQPYPIFLSQNWGWHTMTLVGGLEHLFLPYKSIYWK